MPSKTNVLLCALALSTAAYAVAQDKPAQPAQPGQPGQPGQVRPGQDRPGQDRPGQDRPGQATQDKSDQTRPGQATRDRPGQDRPGSGQDRPGQADRTDVRRESGGQLDAHFAACLLLGNQEEVALSRFAMERAKHEKVKQFAQQMVEVHSQSATQLQKFVGKEFAISLDDGARDNARPGQPRSGDREKNATDTPPKAGDNSTAGQPGQAGQQPGLTNQPGQPRQQAGQPDQNRQPGQTDQVRQPGQTGQPDQSRQPRQPGSADRERSATASVESHGGDQMAHQMMNIQRDIAQKCLALTKAELEKHSADFDQAFLGQQVCCHIGMLAKLEVFEQHASPELKPLIQQAKGTVQEHLQRANQLIKEIETQSSTAGRDSTTKTTR